MEFKINVVNENNQIYEIVFFQQNLENPAILYDALKNFFNKKDINLILNFNNLSSIAPQLIGILLDINSKLIESESLLIIVSTNENLNNYLKKIKIYNIFIIVKDINEAIKKINWERNELSEKYKLSISPTLKFVPAIRKFVYNLLLTKGYSNSDAYRVQSIVDELVTNAIEHGNWKSLDDLLRISLIIKKDKTEVFVHNYSEKREVEKIKDKINNQNDIIADIDSIRGRGLFIVKTLANKLSLKVTKDSTIIKATKQKADESENSNKRKTRRNK